MTELRALDTSPPDLHEARTSVLDVITHCVPGDYPAQSKDKAVTAYLLRTPCIITIEPESEAALDAADLACLGNDLVEHLSGLARVKGVAPGPLAVRMLDKMIGINGAGRNELARAWGYFRRVRQ